MDEWVCVVMEYGRVVFFAVTVLLLRDGVRWLVDFVTTNYIGNRDRGV